MPTAPWFASGQGPGRLAASKSGEQRRRAAQVLGVLYLSGGTLAWAALLLPHWQDLNVALMTIPATSGFVVGPLLLLLRRPLPAWVLQGLLASGTVIVTFGVAFSGSPAASATYAMYYIWVAIYACYYFSRAGAVVQLAIVGVCYAGGLLLSSPDPIVGQWIITVGTISVGGAVIAWLAERAELFYRRLYEGERAVVRQLEEAEGIKDELMAVVSHELRTPLTAIRGYVETLTARVGQLSHDDKMEFLDRIKSQSERLSRLVENMLVASRVAQADTEALQRVAPVVSEIAADMEAAVGHPVPVTVEVEATVGARISQDALHQVLSNLIGNGLKYAAPGTTVRVTARGEGDTAVIRVTNVGGHLPDGQQQRIFEPFVQGGAGTDREPGLGLGLYVVRRLVEAHNGTVEVTSEDGQVTFTVTLQGAAMSEPSDVPVVEELST